MMKKSLLFSIFISILLIFQPVPTFPWGTEGHRMINENAITALTANDYGFPSFLKAQENITAIIFLAPEPDHWRSPSEYALREFERPNHYISLERVLPDLLFRDRYTAFRRYLDKNLNPERVGLLPYNIMEYYDKLKVSFREYRSLSKRKQDTRPVELTAVYHASILAHYIGDGSMPLHLTVHHNGWIGPNPKGYTRDGAIHANVESKFVKNNITAKDFQGFIKVSVNLEDPYTAIINYLKDNFKYVEPLYQLEKDGEFANSTNKAKQFIIERLASASQMLLNLWYTAWQESGQSK